MTTNLSTTRLQRDLLLSHYAEQIARVVALAVQQEHLQNLPAHEREEIRTAVGVMLRSFDLAAVAVAKVHARERFERSMHELRHELEPSRLSESFARALQSYQLHLQVGPLSIEPLPSEEAAYTQGIANPKAGDGLRLVSRDEMETPTGHGRY